MTYKEMLEKTKKKKTENQGGYWNIIGALGRYLSYPVTFVLLPTKITPNQITFISLISSILGFLFIAIYPNNVYMKLLGVAMFWLWNVLDCVDGNIARIKKQFSPVGDLWDAAAGYMELIMVFLAMGVSGYYRGFHPLLIVVMGAISSLSTIYPRLLMHFKYHGDTNNINDKREYGLAKIIVYNIIAADSFLNVIMIAVVILNLEHWFTIVYCILNLLIAIYTSAGLLKE